MKTSTKLLISLAIGLVIAMFGAAVSIRHQYDSIDKKDKYSRWQKKPLPVFHTVEITGPSVAVVQIEPGMTTRLLTDSLGLWKKTTYTYRVGHDTLFLAINPVEGWAFNVDDEEDTWLNPQVVVQLPVLKGVSTVNAFCQIHNFKGDVLTLKQVGKGGSTVVQHLTYNQLNASLSGHNQLTLRSTNNTIARATITARDSSRLFQYSNFKQGLTLIADPTARIRLTGKAVQQLQQ